MVPPQHSALPTPEQRQVWDWLVENMAGYVKAAGAADVDLTELTDQVISRFRLDVDTSYTWVLDYARRALSWRASTSTIERLVTDTALVTVGAVTLGARAARLGAAMVPVIRKAGKFACSTPGRVAIPSAVAYAINKVCSVEGLPIAQRNIRVEPALVRSVRERMERCGCPKDHARAVSYLETLERELPGYNRRDYVERSVNAGRVLRQGELKADVAMMWRLMTEKVYGSGDLPALAAREALQNGVDAIRKAYRAYKRDPDDPNALAPGTGVFEINWDPNSATLTFSDNGYGMSESVLEDKFFVLGASGKTDDVEAAGGFGAAKAVILGVSQTQEWEVWSRDRGAKSLPGMGFNLLEMPWRKGTSIQSSNVKTAEVLSALFGRAQASVHDRLVWILAFSNLPGIELRYNAAVVESTFPGRQGSILHTYEQYDWGDQTTVRVKAYKRRINEEGGGQFYVRLNGIFQFAVSAFARLKSDVVLDVTTKYRPDHSEYPFDASRSHFSSSSPAYSAFNQLRREFERETESADWEPEWDTLLPDSSNAQARKGAEQFAGALQDVMDDSEVQAMVEEVLGGIADFIQEVEQRERKEERAGSEAAADTGIAGQRSVYEKWRDLSDVVKSKGFSVTSAEGRVILGEMVINIVGSADPSVEVPWEVQQAADKLRDGQTITEDDASVVLTALAEVPDKMADNADRSGTSGIPAAMAAAEVAKQVAEIAEADVDANYTEVEARRKVKAKIKKKAAAINPFGAAALVKISRTNYDKKKARKFLKNAAKYIPHLLAWDLALKLIAQEARIQIPFRPGFVLDATVRAVATSEGTPGVDYRSYVLANPDELAAVVKTHKDRPGAIATWLHNIGIHELAHLPRMGRGHNEEFVIEREALAIQTGHLLPAIEQIVTKVFNLKPRLTRREKKLVREATQQARTKQKKTLSDLRAKNKRLLGDHDRLTAIATGPRVTNDIAKRIEALADYHDFREYLLGPGRAFLPPGVDAEALIEALDQNPQVAVNVILGEAVDVVEAPPSAPMAPSALASPADSEFAARLAGRVIRNIRDTPSGTWDSLSEAVDMHWDEVAQWVLDGGTGSDAEAYTWFNTWWPTIRTIATRTLEPEWPATVESLPKSTSLTRRVAAAVDAACAADPKVRAVVAWEDGRLGRVDVQKKQGRKWSTLAHIVVNGDLAYVPFEVKMRYGHGVERGRAHPEYPTPISSPFIVALEAAIAPLTNNVERLAVPGWATPGTPGQRVRKAMPVDLGQRVFNSEQMTEKKAQVARVTSTFLPRIKAIISSVPFGYDSVAMYFTLLDPYTPFWVKGTVASALIYVLSTFDVIPDTIPIAGWADDSAVIYAAMKAVQAHMKPRHWEQAEAWLTSAGARSAVPAKSSSHVYQPLSLLGRT